MPKDQVFADFQTLPTTTYWNGSVSCKVPSVTYLSPAISPGQPTLTLYVLKSKGRLVCSTGIFTTPVLLEKINCISPKFYWLWITTHPFGIPTMSLASTSWNLSKKLQPCLSPGDGLTTMTPCSATSIGQSYAPEERSRNFCYATVFWTIVQYFHHSFLPHIHPRILDIITHLLCIIPLIINQLPTYPRFAISVVPLWHCLPIDVVCAPSLYS